MMTTSTIGVGIRRSLRVVAVPTVMLLTLLTACGDKEAPIDPSRPAEITRLRDDARKEKSLRLLTEHRLENALWLAVLGSGGALALGLAIGSSRRKTGGAAAEGATSDAAKADV